MLNDRLRLILVLAGLFWLFLWMRTFQIQILMSDVYKEQAQNQANRRQIWKPERGQILDRNGRSLADNYKYWTKTGLEYKRYYPQGFLASQVLGYTGKDGQGLQGLEFAFDDKLKGIDGYFTQRVNAHRRTLQGLDLVGLAPTPGLQMVLTIDRDYQEIMENALAQGVKELDADRGSAILIDPNSGEILAMASYPSFDPNSLNLAKGPVIRNDIISLVFEPGSTFKAITAAAAIENGVVNPHTPISSENGRMVLANGDVISDTHDYGVIDMYEAMAVSSNVIYAKVASMVGDEKFYRMVRAFGFGSTTMIELPGEESGMLKPMDRWSARTLLTMAFGHEISSTPLQVAMAYSAIANGGELLQPRLIKEWRDPIDGHIVQSSSRKVMRRVISQETAVAIRTMLRGVVDHGTARNIQSHILDFGGKTGTAEKYNAQMGRYDRNSMVSSFVGMVPIANPRFLCMVVIEEPRNAHVGAYTAGPVFKKIMEGIYLDPRVSPTPFHLQQAHSQVPCDSLSFLGMPLQAAQNKAKQSGCPIATYGNGDKVLSQVMLGDSIRVLLGGAIINQMPNLQGLPLRDALDALGPAKAQVSVAGKGRVVEQDPLPNVNISKNQKIRLWLKERS